MNESDRAIDTVIPPANTPAEINIHLGYLRRDVLDSKKESAAGIEEIKKKLESLDQHFVSQKEFTDAKTVSEKDRIDMKKNIETLKIENDNRKEFQDTLTGKMWGVSMLAGLIVGIISFLANNYYGK